MSNRRSRMDRYNEIIDDNKDDINEILKKSKELKKKEELGKKEIDLDGVFSNSHKSNTKDSDSKVSKVKSKESKKEEKVFDSQLDNIFSNSGDKMNNTFIADEEELNSIIKDTKKGKKKDKKMKIWQKNYSINNLHWFNFRLYFRIFIIWSLS